MNNLALDNESDLHTEKVAPICHFIGGLVAGVAESLVGHPLDTIRVRIMSQKFVNVGGTFAQLSTGFSSFEGICSLYRGTTSELLSAALGGSILFGVNNIFKILLRVGVHEEGVTPGLVLAAVGTGIVDATLYKPLEVIKLRQQAAIHHSSFSQCAKEVWGSGGLMAMYRGMLPAVIREAIGSAAFFAAYELTKVRLCRWSGRRTHQAGHEIILASGGVAGFAYVLVAHPFETAAVLIQLDDVKAPKYRGLGDCFSQVIRERGLLGLYRGVTPTLIRAFPAYAAAFLAYEYTLKLLGPIIRI